MNADTYIPANVAADYFDVTYGVRRTTKIQVAALKRENFNSPIAAFHRALNAPSLLRE